MTVIHNRTVHQWKGNSCLISISIMTSQPQETELLFQCPASVSGLICSRVAPALVSPIKRQLLHSREYYFNNLIKILKTKYKLQ